MVDSPISHLLFLPFFLREDIEISKLASLLTSVFFLRARVCFGLSPLSFVRSRVCSSPALCFFLRGLA